MIQANNASNTSTTFTVANNNNNNNLKNMKAKSSSLSSSSSFTSSNNSNPSSSSPSSLFPTKLHAMLEAASKEGFDDVVAWLHGGTAFKVLDSGRFTEEVMPTYFNQRKYKSFLRQLNLYGFQRIHHGPHKGGYAHKFFIQGAPSLCERINKAAPRSSKELIKVRTTSR
jgi:hypothetical protein